MQACLSDSERMILSTKKRMSNLLYEIYPDVRMLDESDQVSAKLKDALLQCCDSSKIEMDWFNKVFDALFVGAFKDYTEYAYADFRYRIISDDC